MAVVASANPFKSAIQCAALAGRVAWPRAPHRGLATASDTVNADHQGTENGGIPPPLKGIKILDLTSALSGPSATLYLADLG
jgi:succinate--hydroxymethylglutarate CoA-transferase